MNHTRRQFLQRMGYGVGAAGLAATIDSLSRTCAFAQGPGYKALVCVFLAGGNDGNNTVIPNANAGTFAYTSYGNVRQGAGLAIPRANLLSITPPRIGQAFGLHPSLNGLHGLWNQGKVAVVANAGPLSWPLNSPTPRQAYQNNPNLRPLQLFSHSDQVREWQTSRADVSGQSGWGGRIADRFPQHGSGFPMLTSVAGSSIFTVGTLRRPLTIAAAPTALNNVLVLSGFGGGTDDTARRNSMTALRGMNRDLALVDLASEVTDQALVVSAALSEDPTITTPFPTPATSLSNQLLQVAKVIKANRDQPALGLTRQIFFTQLGGFDTHRNQPGTQGNVGTRGLLGQVNDAITAFYNATVELGLASDVTTFTLTDFGRTFQPSGSGAGVGSDHAWGNHAFIVGDGVRGGNFYGVNGPNGAVFPTLQMSGPYDTDTRGRWVPTCSVEQYAAVLARWFGVPDAELYGSAGVFPLLDRFQSSIPATLQFMR